MPRVKGSGNGWVNEQGYRVIGAPDDCPEFLQRSKGTVLEHRWVLFQALGEGRHDCEWCGHGVAWEIAHRTNGSDEERWDALVVDHEDGDRANNALGNLRASCSWCNSNRPFWRQFDVSGEDFRDVHPKDRPKLGELAKKAARAREAKPRAAAPARPAKPLAVPVRSSRWERAMVRLVLWAQAPSLRSLRVAVGLVGFVVTAALVAVWGASWAAVGVVAAAVAVFVAVWVPGPPRSSAGGPVEAAGPAVVSAWPQVTALIDGFLKQRRQERMAAVMGETVQAVAAAKQLSDAWDEDDEDDDDVVVPLSFPDPSKRGRK